MDDAVESYEAADLTTSWFYFSRRLAYQLDIITLMYQRHYDQPIHISAGYLGLGTWNMVIGIGLSSFECSVLPMSYLISY